MIRSTRHKTAISEKNMTKNQFLQHIKQLSKKHLDKTLKMMGVNTNPKK